MRLSISIMAHPSRKHFFDELSRRLDHPIFVIDEGRGLIANCKRSWEIHNPQADFHCVIQDDAIVCENFKERATEFILKREMERIAVHERPYIYNFFTIESTAVKVNEWKGYAIDDKNRGGVAICLPTNQIESMLEFYDTQRDKHDDYRIGQWLTANKFKVCYPIPSLIDHDDNNPSLCSHPKLFRRAYKFVDNL